MKKFSLYIFQAVFCMVLFISCDKAAEENTAGYSTFYLSMPTFSSAAGEKTHWDSQGLWWDTEGEIVKINGIQHQILYDNGSWMTTSTVDTTFAVNNSYYICYMGKSTQDAGWDPNNKVYTNVNLTGIVPLVGEGKTNFITLKPCCAVLLVHSDCEGEISVNLSKNIPDPADTCDISINDYLIKNPKKTVSSLVESRNTTNGNAYFIIPMDKDTIHTTLTITNGQFDELTTQNKVVIERGHVYRIFRSGF